MSDNATAPTGSKPVVDAESLLAKVAETNPEVAAELRALIESGKVQIIALSEAKQTLEAASLVAQQQLTDKTAELATALQSLKEATDFAVGQKETITSLEKQLAESLLNPSPFPSFVIGKKTYEINAPSFKYKGEQYTAAQLLADKALQKELVALGAGYIVEKIA